MRRRVRAAVILLILLAGGWWLARSSRRWLGIELVGTSSNRDAVGARVYAKTAGMRQMREVVLGDGYGSQSTLRQYFGLGDRPVVDEIVVKWPRSGRTQTFRNVAADRIIEIREDRDAILEKTYPAPAANPSITRTHY